MNPSDADDDGGNEDDDGGNDEEEEDEDEDDCEASPGASPGACAFVDATGVMVA